MTGDRTLRAAAVIGAAVLTPAGLWGVAGAFTGVPILIVLAAVGARHHATGPLAALLSADGGAGKADQ